MRIFGKELFNWWKKEPKKSEFLYDFAQHGLLNNDTPSFAIEQLQEMTEGRPKRRPGRKPKKPKKRYTPKELYQAEALNDREFGIEVDVEYIEENVADINDKLSLYKKPKKTSRGDEWVNIEFGGGYYGREELMSIRDRLENRKRLSEFKDIVEEYPHTTSALISDLLSEHENLRCEKADNFVPDFPNEAIKSMKEYNNMCMKLCGQKTTFYVIADKKDFQKTVKRRDPILLAQSPFGHFWQILGAWDEEMIHLADL